MTGGLGRTGGALKMAKNKIYVKREFDWFVIGKESEYSLELKKRKVTIHYAMQNP